MFLPDTGKVPVALRRIACAIEVAWICLAGTEAGAFIVLDTGGSRARDWAVGESAWGDILQITDHPTHAGVTAWITQARDREGVIDIRVGIGALGLTDEAANICRRRPNSRDGARAVGAAEICVVEWGV